MNIVANRTYKLDGRDAYIVAIADDDLNSEKYVVYAYIDSMKNVIVNRYDEFIERFKEISL